MKGLKKWLDAALNLIFPDNLQCICCGDEIMPDARYSCCKTCFDKIPFVTGKTCRICGVPMESATRATRCEGCMRRGGTLAGGLSVMLYEGEAKKLVQDFKYRDKRYLVRPLASMMNDLLQATYVHDFNVLVPVPVHFTRRWLRGFNHAAVLAQHLSELSGIPCIENLLLRSKKTKRLARLTHDERASELQNAFVYNNNYENLQGQTVAIIDDIFTTGSTAEAMAQILVNQGAKSVYVFTLCVTKAFKP